MSDLFTVVREGSLDELREKLRTGAAVDEADAHGWPPLVHAMVLDRHELVAELLGAGASFRSPDYPTLVHLAAALGSPRSLDELLRRGGTVDVPSDRGPTPLMLVVEGVPRELTALLEGRPQYARTVELLLERGADPNRRDPTGRSILQRCALVGWEYLAVVDMLLAAGADPGGDEGVRELTDRIRTTAAALEAGLGSANVLRCTMNHPRVLEFALAHGSFSQGDVDAALMLASMSFRPGSLSAVRALSGAGPSLSVVNDALAYLVGRIRFEEGTPEFLDGADALLAAGARPDVKTSQWHDRSALHVAAQQEGPEPLVVAIMDKLLAATRNVDVEDARGLTPLHLANETRAAFVGSWL